MTLDDKKFEKYLGEFRPRMPRALGVSEGGFLQRWGVRVAVAAVLVLIAGGTLIWMRAHVRQRMAARGGHAAQLVPASQESAATRDIAREVSLVRLETLSSRDPEQLDQALVEASRDLLPHVERPESTLHSLDHD